MTHPRFVFAVFNFPGTTEEDLPLTAGERIEVLSRDDEFGDGWWEGINEAGRQGLFPKIYTSETYPVASASASISSLNDSLSRVEEEGESEASVEDSRNQDTSTTNIAQNRRPTIDVVNQWTPSQVSRYFTSLGLDDVAPKFQEHEVTGRILLAMQHTDLREIDINAFGKRFEIMREIDMLRNREVSQEQYMQQLTSNGAPSSSSKFDVTKRSAARQSRILPAAIGVPSPPTSGSNGTQTQDVKPLTPRTPSSPAKSTNDDSGFPETNGNLINEQDPGTRDTENKSPVVQPHVNTAPSMRESTSNHSLHKKSQSTSSMSLTPQKHEMITGRRSPEKRHSRSWSQDTIKLNNHRRGPSGNLNLDAVGEEATNSLRSTDSGPRSPSSTLGSPVSGALSSPSSINRPTLVPKKSLLSRRPKWRPNAVSENLENVTAPDAAKDADFSGWLKKRGERSYNWKPRYFVLKGTRLAYFFTDRDASEKNIIDINSHKVLPVDDILFMGPNRHIFKLVPPAPGASRALNFTPPKTHYFCAETKEQMRQWVAILTKATIGRDWSTPVISSCTTKTISLKAAQEQLENRNGPLNGVNGLQPGIDLDQNFLDE